MKGELMKKGRVLLKTVALMLLLTALFLPTSITVAAERGGALNTAEYGFNAVSEKRADSVMRSSVGDRSVNTYSLKTVSDRNVNAYKSVPVSLGGRALSGGGRMINGEVYVPIRRFFDSFVKGAVISYDSATRTVSAVGGGHNISVSDGTYALYASGRVFFSATPSRVLSDGRMYVPVSNISRALSLSYSTSSTSGASMWGTPRAVASAAAFYDADVVYWLSRIISAESRGEPLIGQIAVGNVVLNRVRSKEFPNTVWGVIFDRKWGVQFSPVSNGTIYNTPSATSVLAAKICLDGFSVSKDALYFLRPSASTSSWIVNNRPFLFVIGNHYFFA